MLAFAFLITLETPKYEALRSFCCWQCWQNFLNSFGLLVGFLLHNFWPHFLIACVFMGFAAQLCCTNETEAENCVWHGIILSFFRFQATIIPDSVMFKSSSTRNIEDSKHCIQSANNNLMRLIVIKQIIRLLKRRFKNIASLISMFVQP